jgi:small subunit ribosomal protein S4
MKRQHKKYSRPKRPYEKLRIEEENKIISEFGLKNKKEIWKAEAEIKLIREKAKKLISADKEKQKKLFEMLKKKGLNVNSIADILSLEIKDILKRRLQTLVLKKRMATTPKMARQLVVHKKVLVNCKIINIPSYIVPIELEESIAVRKKSKKPVKQEEGEKKDE